MRRSIVSLSLLVASAAFWILGVAGTAGAASGSPRIICPEAEAGAAIVSCCPLPPQPAGNSSDVQPICCPPPTGSTASTPCCAPSCCPSGGCCTPTPCPAGLTIASSPNPSTAGMKVVISGTFAGNPASGAQVALWRKLARQSSFHQVAQTTTDSAGHYTFTLRRGTVMADQAWYVTSGAVQSATIQQHVDALVGLSPSAHSTTVGRTLVLRGRVTPSHAGESVLIEQSRGGAWRLIARARLGRGSGYSVSLLLSRSGAVEFRVVLKADARNERSISRTVRVTVKP